MIAGFDALMNGMDGDVRWRCSTWFIYLFLSSPPSIPSCSNIETRSILGYYDIGRNSYHDHAPRTWPKKQA